MNIRINHVDIEVHGEAVWLGWRDENGEPRDTFIVGDFVDMLKRVVHAVDAITTSAEQCANVRIPYTSTLSRVPDVFATTERG